MGKQRAPIFRAAGTIAPCRFVKSNTGGTTPANDHQVVAGGASTEVLLGISQEGQRDTPGLTGSDITVAANSGDPINIHGTGEVTLLEISSTCNAGDCLTATTGGKGLATTATGAFIGAIALEGGNNQKILVEVTKFTYA